MSKRPTTRTPLSSRLRLPVGRLRDLPIWSKLGLIMIVPIIATIVVGTNGLVNNIGDANDADRARTLSGLSAKAAELVHELQSERANAALLLGSQGNTQAVTEAKAVFDQQVQKSEVAKGDYQLTRTAVADLPSEFRLRLSSIDSQLNDLVGMRQQVGSGGGELLASTVVSRYRTTIDDLLSIRDAAAELANNSSLGADMRAAASISAMKEQVALERVIVLRALTMQSFSPQLRKEFSASITGQEQAEEAFRVVSEPWHRDLFDKKVAGSDLREAAKFEGMLTPLTNEVLPPGIFTTAQWDNAMVNKANLLRGIEVELDEHNIEAATVERNELQRQVLVTTGALLGMLLLAILFAWIVARSMARSLRELRHGALTVAQYGLPQAVARLRDPALANQMSPHQVALQIAEPLPIRSRDEFGQVAEAFNAVHLEAVRTAAEQAALRGSVATMFVNLARRSQILVDRLIGHLDRLERGEEDPDRLAELFQLDHLATRMRRNDENLLVLAGADSTRIQREPAPLMDVLRAAQSEVEHYTRIEFGMIDRDIEIAAHAVNDMVHLVAELLDNATAFSPPDSAVIVEARRVGDRSVLLVEDHGIGVSPEQLAELNDKLANPPMVDVAVSRMMGLVVVARLAARHGVKVELRQARERGTIADMTLPAGVLVPRALAGRAAAGMPTAGAPAVGPNDTVHARPVTPAPRSPLAVAPLALESGPAGGRAGFGALTSSGMFGGDRPGGGVNGFANGAVPNRPATDAPRPSTGPPSGGRSRPVSGGPAAPAGPTRGLPAWSDLTGVNGHDGRTPQPPSEFIDPLPQRRSGDNWPLDGEVFDGEVNGAIPRQRPDSPDPNVVDATVAQAPSETGFTPPVPPSWPPMDPGPRQQPPAAQQPPVVHRPEPRGPYPPADMTAEIPHVQLDWEPEASDDDSLESSQRFVDETMELPIFREVESAWFHTRRPTDSEPSPMTPTGAAASPPVQPAPPMPAQPAPVQSQGTPLPVRPSSAPHGVPGRPPVEVSFTDVHPSTVPPHRIQTSPVGSGPTERTTAGPAVSWQTAADEGWQRAAALAEAQEFATTDTGLPKRVPMSQLVPGGVEKNATSAHRRTPESVRGLLSAYHRGVQRGRTRSDDPKTPAPTTTGPQNSQGGKEQEA